MVSDEDGNVSRRNIIKTGTGLVALGAVPQVTGAKPGRGNGNNGRGNGNGNGGGPPADAKNTCPEGTVLLAKYEVRDGEFVFEKDSDYLEAGDSFEFTIERTKDGGEIVAFTVEDPEGIYDIKELSVKTGEGVFRQTVNGTEGTFDAADYDNDGPVQAVSNVLLCAEVLWQLDFGRGQVPEPPRYSDGRIDDLVLAAKGNGTEDSIENPITNYDEADDNSSDRSRDFVNVVPEPEQFDIGLSAGTAFIEFEDNTADRLHLASFETPGPYRAPEIESQELYDVAYFTESGEGSLTVDLPTASAYTDS